MTQHHPQPQKQYHLEQQIAQLEAENLRLRKALSSSQQDRRHQSLTHRLIPKVEYIGNHFIQNTTPVGGQVLVFSGEVMRWVPSSFLIQGSTVKEGGVAVGTTTEINRMTVTEGGVSVGDVATISRWIITEQGTFVGDVEG